MHFHFSSIEVYILHYVLCSLIMTYSTPFFCCNTMVVCLQEVIEAIAESAFKVSEFPVILSFENHCS